LDRLRLAEVLAQSGTVLAFALTVVPAAAVVGYAYLRRRGGGGSGGSAGQRSASSAPAGRGQA